MNDVRKPSRGVRNKNPGNIDFNPRNPWQGQTGIETGVERPRFATFDKPENGIRALYKLLLNYRSKTGQPGVGKPKIDTIREFISRWAPGNENDTEAYIRQVAKRVGVNPNDSINIEDPALAVPLVTAIIEHENGYMPYDAETIRRGIASAI